MTVNVYLTFEGNCEEAFNYYKSIFGGNFLSVNRFSEMPDNPEFPVPESHKDKLMHISLPVSDETILMGSDTAGFGPPITVGNNFSISVNPDSREEAERIFNALAVNGNVTMPLADTFWEAYFGSCTDQFGINWMVNYTTTPA